MLQKYLIIRYTFTLQNTDIQDGKINCVITKDLSRLGRNYILTGQYTDIIFPKYGVRYIAVHDGVDTITDNNDIAAFRNVLNELYARKTSKKQKASAENRRIKGEFTGSIPPFGYAKDPNKKNHFIIDEPSAEVVKYIFSLAVAGLGGRAIGTILRKEKIKRPSVRFKELGYNGICDTDDPYFWHEQTITKMLHDPVYIGNMVGNKRPTVSFQFKERVKNDPKDWTIVEDVHTPIIDKETFELVQRIIDKRSRPFIEKTSILGGFLKCDVCGKTMARCTTKNGRVDDHYSCRTYKNKGKTACTHHFIRTAEVYQIILQDLQAKAKMASIDEGKLIKEMMEDASKLTKNNADKTKKDLQKHERRINEIDIILNNLYEDKALGRISLERFGSMSAKYDAEYSELRIKVEAIQSQAQSVAETEVNTQIFIDTIKQYVDLEDLSLVILNELVDKVVISEREKHDKTVYQKVEIYYRFIGLIG